MSFYRINVSDITVKEEELPKSYQLLGARGLVDSIIASEVDPTCDPLGPKNKMVFATGLFAGTSVPSSSRTSVGTKSPLTGGLKESSAGGPGGLYLGKLGVKAIIIEGAPKDNQWHYLNIDKEGVQLLPAGELIGLGCYDACKKLQRIHGKKSSIFVIGQAGEKKMLAANIAATDKEGVPTRQFGRGGVGAVMGAKHIKAVVINGTDMDYIPALDKELAKKCIKKFAQGLLKNPVSGNALPKYGTAVLVNIINSIGALPTRNFSSGAFEEVSQISGETMTELQIKRGGKVGHACTPGCVIRCSNIYVDKDGSEITGGFEYESVCLLGSNLGIGNLDDIAYLNRLCDDFGLDTIEVGAALGIAMEAGILPFGDVAAAKEAIQSIARGDILGKVLGQGAKITGQVLGINRIPVVKGQAMAAYDPRGIKGMGAIYAVTPMGADHTAGPSCTTFIKAKPEEQVLLAKEYHIKATALDNTGLCRFCSYAVFNDAETFNALLDIIKSYLQIEVTSEDFWNWGKSILQIEMDFNQKAGFTPESNRIPEYMHLEKLSPKWEVFDITNEELDSILEF
ncbi:aldehyde ferredoxin oxidoreductase C-terminal domain-containing protein [Desulforamulus aquiferis]|uniref:Aldehyde ferredoxin oxidoreductase C-terminal domain-containing protein n=1 Tax=Desulforamulus aquiferis TaxID=1397668 RepID=A0AAW7ZEN3_9FIRM|nr:aldehyde ferredoxin oxidoreductase C-terminal domain-containing protein [Desulforamulus aquiferis]MDO7788183.1 aldehyde ferredoxin oxidoreductase C-terminal domain-containing protein [Desulforamulus aquiferis]